MSYKTILVHVNESRHAATCVKIAAEIAKVDNAYLIGVGTTEPVFDAMVKELGVLSHEKRSLGDDPEGNLCLQGRYADLVVVGQTDPDDRSATATPDLPEYVMLNCGRPVLIVPYAGKFDHVGKNVLVAWDGSMEATRALTDAIPLLKHANNVSVVLFNPSSRSKVHGEQPGADIALYLARHKIKVEVVRQNTDIDVGNALLSLAADLGSDLIVMGGYGHTRFREVLLGGVTMTVLKTMTVPVLMSH